MSLEGFISERDIRRTTEKKQIFLCLLKIYATMKLIGENWSENVAILNYKLKQFDVKILIKRLILMYDQFRNFHTHIHCLKFLPIWNSILTFVNLWCIYWVNLSQSQCSHLFPKVEKIEDLCVRQNRMLYIIMESSRCWR